MAFIIVKTLDRTSAIKGSCYGMNGCRPAIDLSTSAMKGCSVAMYLDTLAIIDVQLAIDGCSPPIHDRKPAKAFIIVRTLDRRLAIKGSCYEMNGRTPAIDGCRAAMYLNMPAIIDVRLAIDRRPHARGRSHAAGNDFLSQVTPCCQAWPPRRPFYPLNYGVD